MSERFIIPHDWSSSYKAYEEAVMRGEVRDYTIIGVPCLRPVLGTGDTRPASEGDGG